MTEYTEKPTRVRGSTANRVSHGRWKINIQRAQKDGSESLVLTLTNVFDLPNSSSKLVSLDLLNNTRIYHYIKDQILYDQSTQKIFPFIKRYKTSFFLHSLNQLAARTTSAHLGRFLIE